MTPEQKKKIDDVIKQLGSDYTTDKLEIERKRAIRTLAEWCCQELEQRKELPEEIKDMKMIARYSLFIILSDMASLAEVSTCIEMAVEAAYNLGKTNKPQSKI